MTDLSSPGYWDPNKLEQEYKRIADVCQGCRRCYNLCPSFNALFQLIDEKDGEAQRLETPGLRHVVDLCYQCKLCFNHCPYTPPHRWDVDFPRLMLRAKAVRVKGEGLRLQDRLLGQSDLLGKIGSAAAPLSNWANKNRACRSLMERAVGIHRERQLPEYHRETFEKWFRRHRREHPARQGGGKVALFFTCFVNSNEPDVGKATVQVLEKNQAEVVVPEQRCCGMPFLDGGDIESALEAASANTYHLKQWVDRGYDIVIPGPTCSYVVKQEYPFLLGTEEAQAVSKHTYDVCEYLMRLHSQGRLRKDLKDLKERKIRIAYQIPCHLRAQNIGFKSRDLLRLVPGAQVEVIEQCSGMDGTWGMKEQFYQISLKVARGVFREIEESGADLLVTDCPLSGIQIAQHERRQVLHPIQVFRDSYESL